MKYQITKKIQIKNKRNKRKLGEKEMSIYCPLLEQISDDEAVLQTKVGQ